MIVSREHSIDGKVLARETEVPGRHLPLIWDRSALAMARLLNRVTRHNWEWHPEKAANDR
jgi:hypothetical protein